MYRILLVLATISSHAQLVSPKQTAPRSLAKPNPTQALVKGCEARLLANEPQDAEICFRRALRQAPANAALHHGLGKLLEKQGKNEQAEAEFRAAIKLDPAAVAWAATLTDFLVSQKAVDKVTLLAPELEARFPEAAIFPAAYGWALAQRGQIEAARVRYHRAATMSGKYAALYYRRFAQVLIELGKTEEAIGAVREMTTITPPDLL